MMEENVQWKALQNHVSKCPNSPQGNYGRHAAGNSLLEGAGEAYAELIMEVTYEQIMV